MAAYTTRIELHGADESDYELLHDEMDKQGFDRTITSDKGSSYHLPWAEYNKETDDDINAVFASAKTATDIVKKQGQLSKDASILVTKSAGRKWSGLEPIK